MASTPKQEIPKKFKLTPEDMWTCLKGTQNWGIEGYDVPRKYFDFKRKKFLDELSKKKVGEKRAWPPLDWPKAKDSEDKQPPKRINFIDDIQKWANSYNNEAKSKELYENLKGKGIFDPRKKPETVDTRKKFLEDEDKKDKALKALPKIQHWKEEAIRKVTDKLEADKAPPLKIADYAQKWSKCDRVSVVADAEYVGETLPFYNTYKKEGEDKNKDKLFFPKKDLCLQTAPIWHFDHNKRLVGMNEQMKTREANFQQKKTEYMSKKNLKEENLYIDLDRAEQMMLKRTRLPWTYPKNFEYQNTEQYKNAREKKVDYTPGPDAYWQVKKGSLDSNVKPEAPGSIRLPDGRDGKIYYLNHQRNDFRIFKPMNKTIY